MALTKLMSENSINPEEDTNKIVPTSEILSYLSQGKSLKEIESEIQASRGEILDHLKHVGAFEFNGRWVTAAPEVEWEMLGFLTTQIKAEG